MRRRSTRKKKKINYNESHYCNDVTDNNGNSVRMDNNGNNVRPLRLTMSLTQFIHGPLSDKRLICNSYKSTFTNYVKKNIDVDDGTTANDIFSPSKGSLFIIEKNAIKSDNQQKNVTTAFNAARKCFEKYFNYPAEDTDSPMPKRQVLKRQRRETQEATSVLNYLQEALNQKLISKEDVDNMTEYYKYRCQVKENLEAKGNAPHLELKKEFRKFGQSNCKDLLLMLPFIQQLYLEHIVDEKKEHLTCLIQYLEEFLEGVKKEREYLFAVKVERVVSMFEEDDDEEDDEEEP